MTTRFSISYFSSHYLCLLLVLSLLRLCFSSQNFDDVLCLGNERRALLQFKRNLIDESNRLASWVGEESDCCKWAGIVCDNVTGHVFEIHLRALEGQCYDHDDVYIYDMRRQRLGGDVNPSLMNLKQLKHLDLSCNYFRRIQVPKFIGSLGNLRYLNLSNSEFGGIIPPQLGNLSHLQVLSLGSFNQPYPFESTSLINMQWLSGLRMLHHLDMSGVDLSQAVDLFQVINTLHSLVHLHLSRCHLSPMLLNVVGLNLTSLSLLDLSENWFDTFLPLWIFSKTSLHSIDLTKCGFNGLNSSSVGFRNLTSLKSLHVSGNRFMNSSLVLQELSSGIGSNLILLDISSCGLSSSVIDSLYNLTSLVSLQMNGNELSKKIPRSLGNFCNMKEINLSGNNFGNISLRHLLESFLECKSPVLESLFIFLSELSGHLPDQLGQLLHLQHLQLGNNHISSAIPNSIGQLSSLRTLNIASNQIFGPIPYSIGRLSLLENLDLSYNRLEGNLPDSIGQLSSLKELDLSNNKLVNCLPHSIGKLSLLKKLHLSDNQLSGIPDSIGGLSSLEELVISHNQLNGNLPDSIGELSSLVMLDLTFNQLNGSLPNSIGGLSSLVQLDLSHNQLNGSLPESIGRLSSLTGIFLSYNQLNGNLPNSIGQLPSLEMLYLSHNLLKGSLPFNFGQLSKLTNLDISNNLLTGVVTDNHFAQLASLSYINGAGNNLTLRPQLENWIPPFQLDQLSLNSWNLGPHFPLWLQKQKGLRHLDISNTLISSPMPHESFWRSLPNLEYLDMSQNHIHGSLLGIPRTPSIINLSDNKLNGMLHYFLCSKGVQMTNSLNLGNNQFIGVIPRCWDKWPSLFYLNLENNNFSGEMPRALGSLSSLQVLNMNGNKLSGILPASLTNLSYLTILQLGKNKLVGRVPAWIGIKLSSLRILNLRSNYFDGNIPHKLCYLTHIQILVLSDNNLSGNIPRCFNNFSVLSGKENAVNFQFIMYSRTLEPTVAGDSLVMKGREDIYNQILGMVLLLDLSCNNFSGRIPSELTSLSKLRSLNLSRNQLRGFIPPKIGDLKELESLDLSMNRLFGELPMSLAGLSFLSSFNVSNNNLTGRVPVSTQLRGFNESSFFGNKLCGAPLTKSCFEVQVPNIEDQKEEDASHGIDWDLIISIVLGFVVGFWIVMAPLMISKSWRITYFCFLSELWYLVCDVTPKYCCSVFNY